MANISRIIRLPIVMDRTGASRSSIYAWMQKFEFPRNLKLGKRASGWLESDIDAWIEARKAAAQSSNTVH
jgi:prophage regulatory protein